MTAPTLAQRIDRFDAYFRSANGAPPNARISVPTAEWQELRAALMPQCLHQIAEPAASETADRLAARLEQITEMECIYPEEAALIARTLRAQRAAPQAAQAAVQVGYVIVPAMPTAEMASAYRMEGCAALSMPGWRAMLAAAPAHPAEGVPAAQAVEPLAVLTTQQIINRFDFLEGAVTESAYLRIVETAESIQRAAALAATPAAPAVPAAMVPPATSRDRWMYEQGRLAERDARTPGSVAAAAPVVLPEPVSDWQIKAVFLANGFTIKDGLKDLKPYVYRAARALLAQASAADAAPAADALDADMFWDSDDGERCEHDLESIIEDYSHGAVLKINRAKSLPAITVRVIQNDDGVDYEVIDAARAAQGGA